MLNDHFLMKNRTHYKHSGTLENNISTHSLFSRDYTKNKLFGLLVVTFEILLKNIYQPHFLAPTGKWEAL